MHVEISEITSIPAEFAAQVRSLYERSFQPQELRDWDDMTASLGDEAVGRTRLIIATQDRLLLGLSFFKYHAEPQFGYLWYLSVDPTTRSAGIGSKLYRQTLSHITDLARKNGLGLKGMMFEVEQLDTESHPEYGDPFLRLKFYDRMGARMIMGYDYRQPPIPPHPEVPLQLMFHPVDLPECDCTQDEIAILVRDFLLHCQGQANIDLDPSALYLQHPHKAISEFRP